MSDAPTPNAQQARRDQVADLARPKQLITDSATIKKRVTEAQEISDTFRVLKKVWLHDYCFIEKRFEDPMASAEKRVTDKYTGRLEPADILVQDDAARGGVSIWLQRWTIHSEHKFKADADAAAENLTAEFPEEIFGAEVVGRNSSRDHDLRSYGTKLLPHLRPSRKARERVASTTEASD